MDNLVETTANFEPAHSDQNNPEREEGCFEDMNDNREYQQNTAPHDSGSSNSAPGNMEKTVEGEVDGVIDELLREKGIPPMAEEVIDEVVNRQIDKVI